MKIYTLLSDNKHQNWGGTVVPRSEYEKVIQNDNSDCECSGGSSGNKPSGAIRTTDDLPEGKKNLYFKQCRVAEAVNKALSDLCLDKVGSRVDSLENQIKNKADVESLHVLQDDVKRTLDAVNKLLENQGSGEINVNAEIIAIKTELAQKVENSVFLRSLAQKVNSTDLSTTLSYYLTKEELASIQANMDSLQRQFQKVLDQTGANPNLNLMELINSKVSREELNHSLENYQKLLEDISNGLQGYATIAYVRRCVEEVRLNPDDFVTKKEFNSLVDNLPQSIRNIAREVVEKDVPKIDTSQFVTAEQVNTRITQESAKVKNLIADKADKSTVQAIQKTLIVASSTNAGFMDSTDKTKLDSLPDAKTIPNKDDVFAVSKRVQALEGLTIPSLDGYATTSWVNIQLDIVKQGFPVINLSPYALTSTVDTKYSSLSQRISSLEVAVSKPIDLSNYATNASVQALANQINSIVIPPPTDTSNFATRADISDVNLSVKEVKNSIADRVTLNQLEKSQTEIYNNFNPRIKALSTRIDDLSNTVQGTTPNESVYATKTQVEQLSTSVYAEFNAQKLVNNSITNKFNTLELSVQTQCDTQSTHIVKLRQDFKDAQSNFEPHVRDIVQQSLNSQPSYATVENLRSVQRGLATVNDTLTGVTDKVSSYDTRITQQTESIVAIKKRSDESMQYIESAPGGYTTNGDGQVKQLATVNYVIEYTKAALSNIDSGSGSSSDSDVSVSEEKINTMIQAALPKTATSSKAGIVKLASVSDLSAPELGTQVVPTLADVNTMIGDQKTASTTNKGLMAPEHITRLQQTATVSQLNNMETILKQFTNDGLGDVQGQITANGQSLETVQSRLTLVEARPVVDPLSVASKADIKKLTEKINGVEAIVPLDYASKKDLLEEVATEREDRIQYVKDSISTSEAKLNNRIDQINATGTTVDLSSYATKEEVNRAVSGVRADIPVLPDFSVYAKQTDVQKTVSEVNENLTNRLDVIQGSLGHYAPNSSVIELKNRLDNLQVPDVSQFVSANDFTVLSDKVDTLANSTINPEDYVTKTNLKTELDDVKKVITESKEAASNAANTSNNALNEVIKANETLATLQREVTPIVTAFPSLQLSVAASASKQYVDDSVKNIETGIEETVNNLVASSVDNTVAVAMGQYVTKTYVEDTFLPKSSFNKDDFIPASEKDSLAKQADVDKCAKDIDTIQLNYSTKEEVQSVTAQIQSIQQEFTRVPKTIEKVVSPTNTSTIDLSQFYGSVIRITQIVCNKGQYDVTLSKIECTGLIDSVTENVVLPTGKMCVLSTDTVIPEESNKTIEIKVAGGGATFVSIVETLYSGKPTY